MLNPHDKLALINSLKKALEESEKLPTTTPCNLCVFFRDGNCSKWKERIPPEVIGVGCEEWKFDQFTPPF